MALQNLIQRNLLESFQNPCLPRGFRLYVVDRAPIFENSKSHNEFNGAGSCGGIFVHHLTSNPPGSVAGGGATGGALDAFPDQLRLDIADVKGVLPVPPLLEPSLLQAPVLDALT